MDAPCLWRAWWDVRRHQDALLVERIQRNPAPKRLLTKPISCTTFTISRSGTRLQPTVCPGASDLTSGNWEFGAWSISIATVEAVVNAQVAGNVDASVNGDGVRPCCGAG